MMPATVREETRRHGRGSQVGINDIRQRCPSPSTKCFACSADGLISPMQITVAVACVHLCGRKTWTSLTGYGSDGVDTFAVCGGRSSSVVEPVHPQPVSSVESSPCLEPVQAAGGTERRKLVVLHAGLAVVGARQGRLRTLAANRSKLRAGRHERGCGCGQAHPRRPRPSLGLVRIITLKQYWHHGIRCHRVATRLAPPRSRPAATPPAIGRRNTACAARVAVKTDH